MKFLLGLGLVGLLILSVVLVFIGPILSIWAVNTLFGLAIPFTVKTWFAAFVLGLVVRPSVTVKKD
jgi:hypothetical protein